MIWLNPAEVQFKISPSRDLKGEVSGGWDIERRIPLVETIKYNAIVAHFRDGIAWIETDLFRSIYSKRLASGEAIRGATSLEELAVRYSAQIDTIFDSLRTGGFQVLGGLPRFLKGRDGEIFIGNQGNHRLAMAHVLGLKSFAGEIVCWHP